jgi:hypothetical protein
LFYIDSDGDHNIMVSALQNQPLFNIVNQRMHIFSHNDTEIGTITFRIKNSVSEHIT